MAKPQIQRSPLAQKACLGATWLLVAAPAAADPQLGDIITVLPLILVAGLYVAAVKSFVWLLLAMAACWAWFWTFDDDFENIPLIAFFSRRKGGPTLKWALTILASLACIFVMAGSVLIDPEVKQRIWESESRQRLNAARAQQANHSGPAPVPENFELPKPLPNQYRNPMGGAWPAQSGLIAGRFAAEPSGGSLEIDNSDGQSGIYLKLCETASALCPGLRHFYVAPRDRFNAAGLSSGFYHARYVETKATDSVRWAKSTAFEIKTGRTIQIKLPSRPGVATNAHPTVAIVRINREAFR